MAAASVIAFAAYNAGSKVSNDERKKGVQNKAEAVPEKVDLIDPSDIETPSVKPIEAEDVAAEAQKGAFDPETGEINWDCPCLGGMADGPCGEEFKEAFSCFVYSKEEPKGIDCIEKFQAMQACFRKHPEVYSEELRSEDPIDSEAIAVEAEVAVDSKAGSEPESATGEVVEVVEVEIEPETATEAATQAKDSATASLATAGAQEVATA
jgi:hypothetical protein